MKSIELAQVLKKSKVGSLINPLGVKKKTRALLWGQTIVQVFLFMQNSKVEHLHFYHQGIFYHPLDTLGHGIWL